MRSIVSLPMWVLIISTLAVVFLFIILMTRLAKYKLPEHSPSGINSNILDINYYGVTIDSHRNGDVIDDRLEMLHGKLINKPENGFYLWVVRRWSTKPDEYYPVKRANIFPARGTDGYEWEVDNCFVGGNSNDWRILEVWLVGPDGHLLISTWSVMNEKYGELMRDAKKEWTGKWLTPSIASTTKDMVCCAQVKLKRK